MGFKIENYTPKGLCLIIYLSLVISLSSSYGQSHCPVRVDFEPRETSQIRSATTMDEVKFPFFQQWDNLSDTRISDDQYATVSLAGGKRSTLFKGMNLGFAIPSGAAISGIELIIEGRTEGNGSVEGLMVRLLDTDGDATGTNQALSALPIDADWQKSEDSTDFVWRYGTASDNWGLTLTDDIINDINFGYAIQVRNKLTEVATVFIDNIEMIVHYTPLYEICSSHPCVPFYIDESDDELVTYEWYLPQGFELISDSENDPAINIGVSYADFGQYEICVESFYKGVSLGICCRKFNYINCEPAVIGGNIFFDKNNDAINNAGDSDLPGFTVNLLTGLGSFVASTSSNEDGNFEFTDLTAGQYYIEVIDNVDSLIFAVPNVGSDDNDSDITNTFGIGTTDIIEVAAGDTINNIGAGFNLALSIGDFVWEDTNGDGVQQTDEPGIADVLVSLNSSTISQTISTDENGFYLFSGLYPGAYNLEIETPSGYSMTIANNGDDSNDSDITESGSINLNFDQGGFQDSIDAGYFIPGSIGDFVWEDLNNNGLQDSDEPGIEGVTLHLFNDNDELVNSTMTDTVGSYVFDNLAPGTYYIEIEIDTRYLPTEFQSDGLANGGSNSDVFQQEGKLRSSDVILSSNQTITNLDFGFIDKPARLEGFTFLDENKNGQYDADEAFVPEIIIQLFNELDQLINSTTSDLGGFYSFENIVPGSYYLVFDLPDDYLFTTPDIGDDLSDSDVTELNGPGSTAVFSLMPDEINMSLSAGYQLKPARLEGFTFLDENKNGQYDDEDLIPGIAIQLFNEDDEFINSTNSDAGGFYSFENIDPGSYYLVFDLPEEYNFTTPDIGDDLLDSDVTEQNGTGSTSIFSLMPDETKMSVFAGYQIKPARLEGFTFLDENNNGQYEGDETFVPEIAVVLFNEADEFISSTTSDIGGFYSFENIEPGSYYLVFDLPEDYIFTTPDIGDDLSDSDVNGQNGSGSTAVFILTPDENNMSISAGYQRKPKVGDFVWLDENSNGIQDSDEPGLNEVLVELFNDQGALIASTTTGANPENNSDGYYLFESLDPGNYYIKVPVDDDLDFATVDQSLPGQNSTITGANGIGTSFTFTLIGNECNNDIDAGYAFTKGNIQGEVWIDQNEDGIQDLTESPQAGTLVELYDENDELIFIRTTNENGEYFFNGLEAGDYYIVFTPSERYDFTASLVGSDPTIDSDVDGSIRDGSTGLITVINGFTADNIDAGLIDGAVSIQGNTWVDDNGDGILQSTEDPLPLVQVDLYNLNDSLLASQTTTVVGAYTFDNIVAGEYYLVFTPSGSSSVNTLADQGMDDNIDDDVTSFFTEGSTDAIVFTFFEEVPPVNAGYYLYAAIGNQVFIDENENAINDDEPGLNDVIVELINADDEVVAIDTTSQGGGLDSGYYLLEIIPPGNYTVRFTRPLFYQFVDANQGADETVDSDAVDIVDNTATTEVITITSGQINMDIDAGVFYQLPMESSVSGIVWEDANANGIRDPGEVPAQSLILQIESTDGQITFSTISYPDGSYDFPMLTEGFYTIEVADFTGKLPTMANIGLDDDIDSDFVLIDDPTRTDTFFLNSFEDITNIDLGLVNILGVGDFVWEDLNNNGVQDQEEPGVGGIDISIFNQDSSFLETVTTDGLGTYGFIDIPAGTYKLCADIPEEFHFAKSNIGADLLDSDVDSTGCTEFIDFTAGGFVNDLDIGLLQNGSIEGVAFVDLNGNGVINGSDPGLDGVVVNLHNADGSFIASTTTLTVNDQSGTFEFLDVKASDYYLVFEFPQEYIITDPNIGNDMSDSDITGQFGVGSTDIFSLPSGGVVNTVDGGAYLPATIGDRVWLDENEDGIQDNDETGVSGIEVIIFRSFGIPFDTTFTDEDGFYQFQNLKQGLYFIQFAIPQEFAISPPDQGIDDAIDSDADGTGKTPLISLAHGANLESVDCGIFSSMASLRSVVWNDLDGDGMRENQEARIPNIGIYLYDDDNNMLDSTETNSLGLYAFQELPEGDYKIFVDISDTDYAFTSMNMNNDDYHDSDIKENGESEIFTSFSVESTLSVPNIDAGLFEGGTIETIAWEDTNADGIYDLEEYPMDNTVIKLYNELGIIVREAQLDGNETIEFSNLRPGKYFMQYEVEEDFVASPIIGELFDENNSDVSLIEDSHYTAMFQVYSNEVTTSINAGFYRGSTISTRVWYDKNNNGLQDEAMECPRDVFVTLFDQFGTSYRSIQINEEGKAAFTGVKKGEYYLKYHSSALLDFTISHPNDELNSDVDHSNGTGTTRTIKFEPYGSYDHIDAGLILLQSSDHTSLTSMDYENELRNQSEGILKETLFEVHPNPAANYVKIHLNQEEPNGIITILDNKNQLIHQGKASDLERIDLSGFHPGIYYIQYTLNDKTITRKLLKIQ